MQRSHEWQVARKGITPIELATLKTEQTNTRNAMNLYKKYQSNTAQTDKKTDYVRMEIKHRQKAKELTERIAFLA